MTKKKTDELLGKEGTAVKLGNNINSLLLFLSVLVAATLNLMMALPPEKRACLTK